MHGVVCGRGTEGSAVMGFEEPICGVGGTSTTWPCTIPAEARTMAATEAISRLKPSEGEAVLSTVVSFQSYETLDQPAAEDRRFLASTSCGAVDVLLY